MATSKILITNYVYGAPSGDYVAKIDIGSEKSPAYVILDTGSSTLAVWADKFGTAQTNPTAYIQFVGYGTGHWAGPVLTASVGMGTGEHYIGMQGSAIAQIQSGIYHGHRQFHPADGIMGLAYYPLNNAAKAGSGSVPISKYDSAYKWALLTNPQYTNTPLPTASLPPFFTELVKAGLTANKLAFSTRRSIAHDGENPATDPLNKGWFILGGGEEHTELYTGEFKVVKEIDDPQGIGKYYNTNLLEVQVGEGSPIKVPSPSSANLLSNSIVDSGTNSLALSADLYDQVTQALPKLSQPTSASDLDAWPCIFFTLEGEGGVDVQLEVKPQTYWQLNSLAPGRNTATVTGNFFNISNSQMPQSILGLPLMNNYYVVFDRSGGDAPSAGTIKFAAPDPSGFPD